MHIETLASCHNRLEVTLLVLADLHAQKLPAGVTMGHTIVDDGSSDGTSQAVRDAFPDVEIIEGDGSLYWAGGMRYGWSSKVSKKKFDYLFVYNNDIRLDLDAVKRLLDAGQRFINDKGVQSHAIVGAFLNKENNLSYGGVVRSSRWHPLRFKLKEPPQAGYFLVDTANMNACLISEAAIRKVGFLSDYFIHGAADFEYGLKLKRAGGEVVLSSGPIGKCERNGVRGTSSEPKIPLLVRYKRLVSVKEQPIKQRFLLYKNYGGTFWPLFWILPYLTIFAKHFFDKLKNNENGEKTGR